MTAAIECINACKAFREAEGVDDSQSPGASLCTKLRRAVMPRRVRVEAVRDVSFTVERGEKVGILGRNGSGKSTLIRLIATLLTPDSGAIRVFGKDVVSDRLAVRRSINRVSVEAAFFKRLSALENLEYAARLYGLDVGTARQDVQEILRRLDFPWGKMTSPLENLSRGMQQKVAVARALMTSPVALLLDEPTTGLDPVSKREVQDFVLDVCRAHDTTVILTTHDMLEAERLCDRIAVIDEGRFVALGTPHSLRAAAAEEGQELPSLEEAFFKLTGTGHEEWLREGGDCDED